MQRSVDNKVIHIVQGAGNTGHGSMCYPRNNWASQFIVIELTLNQNKLLLTRISTFKI